MRGARAATVALSTLLLVIAVAGLTVLVTRGAHHERLPVDPTCATAPLGDRAEIRAAASIEVNGLSTPRLTSRASIRIPATEVLAVAGRERAVVVAADLLQAPEDAAYKAAVQCLLSISRGALLTERRTTPPTVTYSDGVVNFEDVAQVDLTEPHEQQSAGLFGVEGSGPRRWALVLRLPPVLADARWVEVGMIAPAGWLSSPTPWPPAVLTATELRWTPDESRHPPGVRALLERDRRADWVTAANAPPQLLAATVARWAASVMLPIGFLAILLLGMRRGNALHSARLPSLLSPFRIIGPVVLIVVVASMYDVLYAWLDGSGTAPWTSIHWYWSSAALLSTTVIAVAWRLNAWAVAASGLLGVCSLGVVFALSGGSWSDPSTWTKLDTPTARTSEVAVAYSVAGFVLGLLALVGLMHVTWTLLGKQLPKGIFWIAGGFGSLLLIVERLMLNLAYYDKQEWLTLMPLGAGRLAYDLPYYSVDFLVYLSSLVLVIPPLYVWHAFKTETEPPSGTRVKMVAGFLMLMGVCWWTVHFWGWTLPAWAPTLLALCLMLRRLRELSGRTSDGRTMRDLVGDKDVSTLRTDVAKWQVHLEERFALERALASDSGGMEGYKLWAEKLPPSLRTSAPERTQRRRSSPSSTSEGVPTPLDVLLSVGPEASAVGNMRTAAKLGVRLGALPAMFITWVWFRQEPPQLSSPRSSILLDLVILSSWTFAAMVFGAATLGLLWRYLPGRRGPVKALPIALLFSATPVIQYLLPASLGGVRSTAALSEAAIFTAVLMVVAVTMDHASLRSVGSLWTRPHRPFMEAYGLQNLSSKLAVVLAQLGAIIAIYSFLRHGGDPPSGPNTELPIRGKTGSTGA